MNKNWLLAGVTGVVVLSVFYIQTQNKFVNTSSVNTASKSSQKVRSVASSANAYAKVDYDYKGIKKSLDDHILDIANENEIIPLANQILAWDEKHNRDENGSIVVSREVLRLYAIAAQYVPIAKGLVYRMREIANKDIALYSLSLTALREMSYNSSEAPAHLTAVFEYLTNPNPKEVIEGQKGIFSNINDASNFFIEKIAPRLEKSITELDTVINNGDLNRPVMITNLALSVGQKVATSIKNLPENQSVAFDKIVLAAHLEGVKAQAETFLASAYYIGSFNTYGSHKFTNKLVMQTFKARKLMNVSEFFGKDIMDWNNLPSPKEATKFLKNVRTIKGSRSGFKYKNFLKLKDKHFLAKSKMYFTNANESDYKYHKSLIDLASLPSQESYVVNAAFYSQHAHGPVEIVNIRRNMFNNNSAVEIKNFTTNEKLSINIHSFFDPSVVSDLTAYMPNKFNKGKEFKGRKDNLKWNYSYGRSEGWPDAKFGGLLPEGTSANVRKNLATIYQHPALAFLIPVMTMYR
jgi:hypothetical protein